MPTATATTIAVFAARPGRSVALVVGATAPLDLQLYRDGRPLDLSTVGVITVTVVRPGFASLVRDLVKLDPPADGLARLEWVEGDIVLPAGSIDPERDAARWAIEVAVDGDILPNVLRLTVRPRVVLVSLDPDDVSAYPGLLWPGSTYPGET